jgi:hypothetical protein
MATKPTPAEVAQTTLEIAVIDLELRPDNYIPDQALKAKFQARGGVTEDIKHGLKYAHDRGWLRYDNDKEVFLLTDDGYTVA